MIHEGRLNLLVLHDARLHDAHRMGALEGLRVRAERTIEAIPLETGVTVDYAQSGAAHLTRQRGAFVQNHVEGVLVRVVLCSGGVGLLGLSGDWPVPVCWCGGVCNGV